MTEFLGIFYDALGYLFLPLTIFIALFFSLVLFQIYSIVLRVSAIHKFYITLLAYSGKYLNVLPWLKYLIAESLFWGIFFLIKLD